ncbi:uncharacterized protein M6B38_374380 [Iris pallida]|uniref:Uncharacterized protein n=1 Tax=Iris pallida TaxID=29817 RepID=A0AAX6GCT2_IRIPA|nr:uncharacterized protein M6B38_374380 [Iris pallida]
MAPPGPSSGLRPANKRPPAGRPDPFSGQQPHPSVFPRRRPPSASSSAVPRFDCSLCSGSREPVPR